MTTRTPWNSIAEGVVDYQGRQLSYAEGIASPCTTCETTPCCTHLPLQTFKITNMLELDHAVYALNFAHIELGLSASGDWNVYYKYPCRFLNRANFRCIVHDTPQQPQICRQYNPYSCWYKRVMTQAVGQDYLPIDQQRMDFVLSQIVCDEFRNIIQVPAWETLVEVFQNLPPAPVPMHPDPVEEDASLAAWRDAVLNPDRIPVKGNSVTYTYTSLQEPCHECEAYCCQTLIFPHPVPRTASALDYFRFCLGFPGIELGLADDGWQIVVKTTCRHLQNRRCAIYGKTERPLLCKYYDAWKCTYRINFGLPKPPTFVRLRLEQFESLAECFQFDQYGDVMQIPSIETVREAVETQWRTSLSPS